MTPKEAIERYNAVASSDAKDYDDPCFAAYIIRNTPQAAGWRISSEVPSRYELADYLDPLTFDKLEVGEVFRFDGKASGARAKLSDELHARVTHPNTEKVIRLECADMQTADPDAKVERVD